MAPRRRPALPTRWTFAQLPLRLASPAQAAKRKPNLCIIVKK
jgi:hypothetical protein